ncbi:zinc knuckle (CCHC-type) family protein [Zea mays]|uniref:Zinc knuckle (CCHC-type) family protein n=1 Tax=Zea mays TaxID=4577 RepID=A0A1D6NA96_MAIZE|nr:zinc knuckle (CCHC-type) family protein [Zea mays]
MSPLSELVWSPDEGLSIKIAASSLSTRKASLRWNADTLSILISSPQRSGSGPEVSFLLSDLTLFKAKLVECCEGINVMNEGKEESENCCVDKLEDMEVGNCPTRCCKDASHSSASRKKVVPSISENQACCATTFCNERSWETNAWRARLVKAVCQKESILPTNTENPILPSSIGISCDAVEFSGKLVGSQGKFQSLGVSSNALEIHSHDNCQDPVLHESHKDEPVIARGESASGVNIVARCESVPGVDSSNFVRGKEKVMYNDSNCGNNTREGDDSNESIESCTSTKAPKRKHAQCCAATMPSSGNKRFRREDNESSCSGLLQKCGTSFFNWMSSLTNGLPMLDGATAAVPLEQKFSASTGDGSAAPSQPLQNNRSVPMQFFGFNSLFQSLYTRNVMITSGDNCRQPESNCAGHVFNRLTLELNDSNSMLNKEIGMGRETLDLATQTSAAEGFQMISGGCRGNVQSQIDIFQMRPERNMKLPSSSKFSSRSLEEKQNQCTAACSNDATQNKGGLRESLWVTRLLPKASVELMEATPCNVENAVSPQAVGDKLCCPPLQNFNLEKELNNIQYFTGRGSSDGVTSSKCPATPPEEPKQSETMASVFAKRLDALRHANTSAVSLAIACEHGSPKLRNHKTNSFVVSYSSHDKVEAGHENHKSSSGNGRIVLWVGDKGKEPMCLNNEELRGNFISEREHQHHGGNTAGKLATQHNLELNILAEDTDRSQVELKGGVLDFMAGPSDNKQIVPYGTMSNDESSVIFGALHRLRLSRSDILRWLRSPIMHTTLDGFFVRLRFGKWEEALGGTGYHVARLNGALDRSRLSVTIRNSTCQVDSRFVSNHDFHEDELKAWWSAAMKGEWKLPSKEELGVKLREKELLRS